MPKQDFRKLDLAQQEHLRKIAIDLLEKNNTQSSVAGVIGVSRQTVNQWLSKAKRGDPHTISGKPRKRPRKNKTKLRMKIPLHNNTTNDASSNKNKLRTRIKMKPIVTSESDSPKQDNVFKSQKHLSHDEHFEKPSIDATAVDDASIVQNNDANTTVLQQLSLFEKQILL